jgi:predicted regulator of Ras-like GTPase activity (Roadblock/LC7/MglB family)
MQDILSEMASGLTGIRLITVTDRDCMVLASWESPENKLSPEALGEFIQKVNDTVEKFKQSANGFSKLDDVILGTSFSYMMIKPICNGACFVVADAPRTASLGAIRTAFTNFASKLEQAIPGREPWPTVDGVSLTASEV